MNAGWSVFDILFLEKVSRLEVRRLWSTARAETWHSPYQRISVRYANESAPIVSLLGEHWCMMSAWDRKITLFAADGFEGGMLAARQFSHLLKLGTTHTREFRYFIQKSPLQSSFCEAWTGVYCVLGEGNTLFAQKVSKASCWLGFNFPNMNFQTQKLNAHKGKGWRVDGHPLDLHEPPLKCLQRVQRGTWEKEHRSKYWITTIK